MFLGNTPRTALIWRPQAPTGLPFPAAPPSFPPQPGHSDTTLIVLSRCHFHSFPSFDKQQNRGEPQGEGRQRWAGLGWAGAVPGPDLRALGALLGPRPGLPARGHAVVPPEVPVLIAPARSHHPCPLPPGGTRVHALHGRAAPVPAPPRSRGHSLAPTDDSFQDREWNNCQKTAGKKKK